MAAVCAMPGDGHLPCDRHRLPGWLGKSGQFWMPVVAMLCLLETGQCKQRPLSGAICLHDCASDRM